MASTAASTQPMTRARILVVEDHDDLAEALEHNLKRDGHAVTRARDGRDALLLMNAGATDLVILDLGLPRLDGLTVLDRLRQGGHWCPVLILSARGAPDDKVEGFRLGADDYVTKPFHTAELMSRVRALLRRSPHRAEAPETASESKPAVPASTAGSIIGYTEEELVKRFAFTARQASIARLLAEGLTNPEIADLLGISRFTARNHAEQVMVKLDVTTRGRVAGALRAAYDADTKHSS